LRLLAQADLVLDTANPDINLLEAVVRVTDKVPDLRVVIDLKAYKWIRRASNQPSLA
jgi:hypothetical protein